MFAKGPTRGSPAGPSCERRLAPRRRGEESATAAATDRAARPRSPGSAGRWQRESRRFRRPRAERGRLESGSRSRERLACPPARPGAARPGPRPAPGLLIPRCRCVHTFGMRFPLDVVFLDDAGQGGPPGPGGAPLQGGARAARRRCSSCPRRRPPQTSGKPIRCSPVAGSSARSEAGSAPASGSRGAAARAATRASRARTRRRAPRPRRAPRRAARRADSRPAAARARPSSRRS